MTTDPYQLSAASIQAPPAGFREKLKHLGPGFILSATIVGSGELIATTTLGAKAGFITFWVIIVSCLVKVAIQIEFDGAVSAVRFSEFFVAGKDLPEPGWQSRPASFIAAGMPTSGHNSISGRTAIR